MVVLSVLGTAVSDVREMKTFTDVPRVFFTLESLDEGSLPMRWEVVSFGNIAQRVLREVKTGTQIFCTGRLSQGGPQKRISLALSAFQVLEGASDNVE